MDDLWRATMQDRAVVFDVGSEVFGIHIGKIRSVVLPSEIETVSSPMGYVRGLMRFREDELAVIDLRLLFELGDPLDDPDTRVLIATSNGITVGLIVDKVADIFVLSGKAITPVRELLPASYRLCISTIVKAIPLASEDPAHEERLTSILDPDQIFRAAIRESFRSLDPRL